MSTCLVQLKSNQTPDNQRIKSSVHSTDVQCISQICCNSYLCRSCVHGGSVIVHLYNGHAEVHSKCVDYGESESRHRRQHVPRGDAGEPVFPQTTGGLERHQQSFLFIHG